MQWIFGDIFLEIKKQPIKVDNFTESPEPQERCGELVEVDHPGVVGIRDEWRQNKQV